jgi:hypothetical protein
VTVPCLVKLYPLKITSPAYAEVNVLMTGDPIVVPVG